MDNNFLEELKEILDPHEDIESNKEGFEYGGYIEWPSLDDYEDHQVEEVLSLLGIEIPFGSNMDPLKFFGILKNMKRSEREIYEDIYNESIIKKEDEEFSVEEFENLIMEYEVEIPTVKSFKSSITAVFEKNEVPQDVQFENDEYIPESSKKWPLIMDDDFYFIKQINLNEYKNEIEKIKNKISKEEDVLIKKSLMLTIFVLSESYVSSLIISNLPDRDESLIDKTYERIIQQYISDNIRTRNGRKALVKDFFGKNMIEMPHTRLRDALAHEIDNVELKDNRFKYDNSRRNKKENIIEVEIEQIINELEQFYTNLDII